MTTKLPLFTLSSIALCITAQAQISFTGNYSENFDGMGVPAVINTTTATTPTGWTSGAVADSTVALATGTSVMGTDGSGFFSGGPTTAANQGRYNVGGTGVNPDSDRALGTRATGTAPAGGDQVIDVAFTNNTGSTLESFNLTYTGETWVSTTELNGNYLVSFSTTGLVGSWTALGAAFNYVSPITADQFATQYDGNDAARRQTITGTVTGISVAQGSNFYLRFYDDNEANNDKLIAIDDFSITSASAIPEPASAAAFGGLFFLGFAALRRRRA
jgi:hypothetical protein